jgi:hypothetical protein
MAGKKDRRERRRKYTAPELKKGDNLRRISAGTLTSTPA